MKAPEIVDDPMKPIRQYCTCPACQVIWPHKEWGSYTDNWQDARRRYAQRVTCPECGAVSEPPTRDNSRWWWRMLFHWRVLVADPVKVPAPFDPGPQAGRDDGRDR